VLGNRRRVEPQPDSGIGRYRDRPDFSGYAEREKKDANRDSFLAHTLCEAILLATRVSPLAKAGHALSRVHFWTQADARWLWPIVICVRARSSTYLSKDGRDRRTPRRAIGYERRQFSRCAAVQLNWSSNMVTLSAFVGTQVQRRIQKRCHPIRRIPLRPPGPRPR